MSLDAFCELSRRSIIVNKLEETSLSWYNSTLAIRTEKGLHFINFSHNLECLDKMIDVIETYIPNPTNSPASHIFAVDFIKKGMSNMEYTEMFLNPALWAHNTLMTKNLANISVFEWSPVDFLENNQCALAILSNIGSVELYGQIRDKWVHIYSLSPHVCKIIEDQLIVPENLSQLKQTAYVVHTSAICWAPTLIDKNSSYLMTAQKNGDILFWHLKSSGIDINAKLHGIIKTETCEISSMLWVPILEDKFILVFCNLLGEIFAFDCIINKEEVKYITPHTIWHNKDKMIAKCLQYVHIQNKNLLIYIKHRHLVIQMLDENCKILSQSIHNVNDYRITCIRAIKDNIFLTTINFQIYKVNIKVLGIELSVTFDAIENRESFNEYEVTSVGFSSNNLIWAVGTLERKVLCRKEPVKIDIVLMTTEKRMENAITILLNNPTKKLTDYWDCIELLRYKIIKTNIMPLIEYDQLYMEGQTDVYKLKIYLILLTIYNTLKKTARISGDLSLPETCIDNVKEQIFCSQAIRVLKKICEHKMKKNVNNFEIESFHGAKRYIESYCQNHNKNVSNLLNGNLLESDINPGPTYVCQACDKKLDGFSCEDQHLNMFCFLSLTFIENIDDYLVCKNCGLTARTELFPDKPICLFCDLYLCKA